MFESFWGKDPFDDPFFTDPFDGKVGSKKEITIEELDNDDDDTRKNSDPSKAVAVAKTPDESSRVSNSFSYRRVAYGGVNGMYYSSSVGRRTGGDGVVLLEIKEEDKTAGQALHTISRGIHDKGHTLTKKLNPDGREDSLQILHNLNEDELTGFEENWKVNADKHIPGWNDGFKTLENTGLSSYLGWGHGRSSGEMMEQLYQLVNPLLVHHRMEGSKRLSQSFSIVFNLFRTFAPYFLSLCLW